MKCPVCSCISSDKRDLCPKCGLDLRAHKQALGLPITNPRISTVELRTLYGMRKLSSAEPNPIKNEPTMESLPATLPATRLAPENAVDHEQKLNEPKRSWLSGWRKKADPELPLQSSEGRIISPSTAQNTITAPEQPAETRLLTISLDKDRSSSQDVELSIPDLMESSFDALAAEKRFDLSSGLTDEMIAEAASLLAAPQPEDEEEQLPDVEQDLLSDTQPEGAAFEVRSQFPSHTAPEVMEFGDDDALLEQQLDALLGDDTLEVTAVKDERKPIIAPNVELDLEFDFSDEGEEELHVPDHDVPTPDNATAAPASATLESSASDCADEATSSAENEMLPVEDISIDDLLDGAAENSDEKETGESNDVIAEDVSDEELNALLESLGDSTDETPEASCPVTCNSAVESVGAEEALYTWTTPILSQTDNEPLSRKEPVPVVPEPGHDFHLDTVPFAGMVIEATNFVDEVSVLLAEAYGLDVEYARPAERILPETAVSVDPVIAATDLLPTSGQQLDNMTDENFAAQPTSQADNSPLVEEQGPPLQPASSSTQSPSRDSREPYIAPEFHQEAWNALQQELKRFCEEKEELEISSSELWNQEPTPQMQVLFDMILDEAIDPTIRRNFMQKIPTVDSIAIDNRELAKEFRKLEKQALVQAAREEVEGINGARKLQRAQNPSNLASESEEWASVVAPARVLRRVAAKLIDMTFSVALGIAISLTSFLPFEIFAKLITQQVLSLDEILPFAGRTMAVVLVTHLLLSTMLIAGRGKTVGKSFLKVSVVQIDGFPVTLKQAVLRSLLEITSALSLGLALLPATKLPRRVLHDRLSDTIVVQDDF